MRKPLSEARLLPCPILPQTFHIPNLPSWPPAPSSSKPGITEIILRPKKTTQEPPHQRETPGALGVLVLKGMENENQKRKGRREITQA